MLPRAATAARGTRPLRPALVAAVLLALAVPVAAAAPGQLDRSFGVSGLGGGDLGPHYGQTRFSDVSVETGGALLATRDGTVYRYLPDGRRDPGFAPREEPEDPYWAEARQRDGKLLVVEGSAGKVRRLNPDGTPDGSFHGGESEAAPIYFVSQVEELPSGRVLIAGRSTFSAGTKNIVEEIALARFNADGTLDRGFGKDGVVEVRADFEVVTPVLEGLAVDADDDGVLLVTSEALIKLTPDGSPDPGFGANGVARLERTAVAGFRALPGGGALLAGSRCCAPAGGDRFFVARYRPDGSLDPGFAAGRGIGVAAFEDRDGAIANTVLWEEDGGVVIGGAAKQHAPACWETGFCASVPALVRFTADGALDTGFGSGGLLKLDGLAGWDSWPNTASGVQALAARPGGSLIAAGTGDTDESVAFLAALDRGSLDPAFGDGGIVAERSPKPSFQIVRGAALGPGGAVYVAAETDAGPGTSDAIVRYTAQGAVDRDYGGGSGYAVASRSGDAVALAVDRAGAAFLLTSGGIVSRVDPAGVPDWDFARRGLPFPESRPRFRAIAVRPDGKVLIAGTTSWLGRRSRMIVARLLPDGRLDRSFGEEGIARVGCRRRGSCRVARIALEPDGRILLVGSARGAVLRRAGDRTRTRLALARLLPGGTLDPSFGRDGFLTRWIGERAEASALAPGRRGILVAGWTKTAHGPHALLLRYRLDGSLDRSFGRGGIAGGRAGIPTAVLPTSRRIVVVVKGTARPAFAFRRDGSLDRAYRRFQLPDFRENAGRTTLAVAQGGSPILVWGGDMGQRAPWGPIRLARLENR